MPWPRCQTSTALPGVSAQPTPKLAPSLSTTHPCPPRLAMPLTLTPIHPYCVVDAGFNHYRKMKTAVPAAPWLTWWPQQGLAIRRHRNACDKNFYDYVATRRFDQCILGTYMYGSRAAWQRMITAFNLRAASHASTEKTWGVRGERRMCSDQDIFEEVASEDPTLVEELLPSNDWSWDNIVRLQPPRLPKIPLRSCNALRALNRLQNSERCESSDERQSNQTVCESSYLTLQSGHRYGMWAQCVFDTSTNPSRCVDSSLVVRCHSNNFPTCKSIQRRQNLRGRGESCNTSPHFESRLACESYYVTHKNGRVSPCLYDASAYTCRASPIRLRCP